MAYERLIKTGRIQVYSARVVEINQLIQVARRDLQAAGKNLDESPDWAFTMAYNAALQAGRALMLHEGYRPRGAEQHATVVEFVEERLGSGKPVRQFDQMRRKRHKVIYEAAGLVSHSEAEQAITFAIGFVESILELISGQARLGI